MFQVDITNEERKRLDDLIKSLNHFKKRLMKSRPKNEELFFETMHDFWDFMRFYSDREIFEGYLEKSEWHVRNRSFFVKCNEEYIRVIELQKAMAIISSNLGTKDYFSGLKGKSGRFVKENYEYMSNEVPFIEKCKNVVMVGCGSFPETLIYIKDHYPEIKLTSIDNSQEAVSTANRLLDCLGYNDIDVWCYDGCDFDYSPYDGVILASFLTPKRDVINRVAETACNDTVILARDPDMLTKLIFDSASEALHNRLSIEKRTRINPFFMLRSLLLKKLDL